MNILVIGFGSISRAFFTLDNLPINKLIIIDKKNYYSLAKKIIKKSFIFVKSKLTKNNLDLVRDLLVKYNINIVMDLSYNIYSFDIIKILPPNVSYMNTSIEEWEENNNSVIESLKFRQDEIISWYNETKPPNTIFLDIGMNPGLVNLWAYDCCKKFKINPKDVEKVIISEYDSQSRTTENKKKEFVNTWCCQGYNEEIHSYLEGTDRGKYYIDKNKSGFKTLSFSLRPDLSPFVGYTVRHSETITLKKLFPNATSMFIYKSCDDSIKSLNNYYDELKLIVKEDIFYSEDMDDSKECMDEVGIWLSTKNKIYWYGSQLSNKQVKMQSGSKYKNSTGYQVAKGLFYGLNVLIYCHENNINKLLWTEDTVNFPIFDKLLEKCNEDLEIKIIDHSKSKNKNLLEFKNMKSFKSHIL